jgi:hypothetical protein
LKIVRENLNEYVGGGYSTSGSMYPSVRGGSLSLGNSANSMGSGSFNSMYTYDILPLNRTLEPKVDSLPNDEMIHSGMTVKGKKFNDKKVYKGKLVNIVKSKNGVIKYYIILDEATAKFIKIDPTTIQIDKDQGKITAYADIWNFGNGSPFTRMDTKLPKFNNQNSQSNIRSNENRIVPENLEQLFENEELQYFKGPSREKIEKRLESLTLKEKFEVAMVNNIDWLVEDCLKQGINPSIFDNAAIWWASNEGKLEIVKLLLKDPIVDPTIGNNVNINNNFPLYGALHYKHFDIVRELLKDKRVRDKLLPREISTFEKYM